MSQDRDAKSAGAVTPTPSGATATASAETVRKPANPRLGYSFAVMNAIISGVAIYVNSRGVGTFPKTFAGSTLYTGLKNAVVGVCVLVPLLFLADARREIRHLNPRQWGLLVLVALIGGSVAYALNFRGLQISGAVTASLTDHAQFLFVAIFALVLLHERFGPAIWLALVVLFVGLSFGIAVKAVRVDAGLPLLLAASLLFAFDFIVIKYLLRSVSMLTVMIFKMSVGAALLLAYVGLTGNLGAVRHLSATQWQYALVTGLILLAFTITSIAGLRHASATAVIAIGAGSPIITTALVVFAGHTTVPNNTLLGLGLVVAAILVIYTFGQRQELRQARTRAPAQRHERQRAVPA